MAPNGELVLLTGISGFIAKHVALALLDGGYRVRGSLRSLAKRQEVIGTLEANGADVSRLEFVEADLAEDAGWDEAAAGCDLVQHTASPFPSRQPKEKFGLVPIARGGTLRVVEAAKRAGVRRLVLTSSVAAVQYGHEDRPDRRFGEADFSDVRSRSISPYAVSKTEAERAAWAAVEGSGLELAVVNPAFVLGPLLDRNAGTSAELITAMMKGRLPLVPDLTLGIVDVRDVALAHVAAMQVPEAAGRRFILSAGMRNLRQIGDAVAARCPAYRARMPRATLPDFAVRAAALISSQARMVAPELGGRKMLDTRPAEVLLGLSFRSPDEAAGAMADSLIRNGLV